MIDSGAITVIRSPRKTLSIEIEQDGSIVVRAPQKLAVAQIESFIHQKEKWICEKRQLAITQQAGALLSLENGSRIPYLGNTVDVRTYSGSLPMLRGRELLLPEDEDKRLEAFLQWRISEADLLLRPRVRYWCEVSGIGITELCFGNARRLWGTMRADGKIRLNAALIHRPMNQAEYVIVHELCHRLYLDHSPAFHQKVESLLPGAALLRKTLKNQGPPAYPVVPAKIQET